jgi:hypothetical protein
MAVTLQISSDSVRAGSVEAALSLFVQIRRLSGVLGALGAPNTRAAIIMNAEDALGPTHLTEWVQANKQAHSDPGTEAVDPDLRDYFDKPAELVKELGRFELILGRGS